MDQQILEELRLAGAGFATGLQLMAAHSADICAPQLGGRGAGGLLLLDLFGTDGVRAALPGNRREHPGLYHRGGGSRDDFLGPAGEQKGPWGIAKVQEIS